MGTSQLTELAASEWRQRAQCLPPPESEANDVNASAAAGLRGTAQSEAGRVRSALVDDDPAALDHHLGFQPVPVAFQRVTVQEDDVGKFPGGEFAERVAHLDV